MVSLFQSSKILWRLALLAAVALCLLGVRRGTFSSRIQSATNPRSSMRDNLLDVKNSTLGFQKIMVLSMADRTDRRDALALASSFSGFDFEFFEGVKGDSLSENAKPLGWGDDIKASALGCWRGHMDIAQKMIRENIQSVLILEDDADWDVLFKAQLVEFARGSRYVLGTGHETSPYGDDWDILWFGHCGAVNDWKKDHKVYVIQNDTTVVPPKHRLYPSRRPNYTPPQIRGDYNRLVFKPRHSLCTTSYGISSRGAKKLVYNQAMSSAGTYIDRALSRMCNKGATCVSSYPQLIGAHRQAGNNSRNSDIDPQQHPGGLQEAYSEFMAYPTRLNIDRFIAGETTFKSQFPGDTLDQEVSLETELPRGNGEFLTKDQFEDPF